MRKRNQFDFDSYSALLGFSFGFGGFAGMYLGARFQKYIPQEFIKIMLDSLIAYISLTYIVQFLCK